MGSRVGGKLVLSVRVMSRSRDNDVRDGCLFSMQPYRHQCVLISSNDINRGNALLTLDLGYGNCFIGMLYVVK